MSKDKNRKELKGSLKRWKCFIGYAILFLMLFLPVQNTAAMESVSFSLPVKFSWGKDGLIKGKSYQAVLSADGEEVPMPEGSSDGVFSLKLQENEKIAKFPEIVYTAPGEYGYWIEILRGKNVTLQTYYLQVVAAYGKDGELMINLAVHKDDQEGVKVSEIKAEDKAKKENPDEPIKEKETEGNHTHTGNAGGGGNTQGGSSSGNKPAVSAKTGDDTKAEKYIVWCMLSLSVMFLLGKKAKRYQEY